MRRRYRRPAAPAPAPGGVSLKDPLPDTPWVTYSLPARRAGVRSGAGAGRDGSRAGSRGPGRIHVAVGASDDLGCLPHRRPTSYSCVVSNGLPPGISEILEYLAQMARGYDNHLKWNEVAKLKADLMNVPGRWRGVSVSEIADSCRTLGMREEDAATVVDLVRKAQEGRRLVPQKTYRDFRFNQPVD